MELRIGDRVMDRSYGAGVIVQCGDGAYLVDFLMPYKMWRNREDFNLDEENKQRATDDQLINRLRKLYNKNCAPINNQRMIERDKRVYSESEIQYWKERQIHIQADIPRPRIGSIEAPFDWFPPRAIRIGTCSILPAIGVRLPFPHRAIGARLP